MWKLLLLFSLIPLAAALAVRWWCGLRVLAAEGGRLCRCERDRWLPLAPGEAAVAETVEGPAAELGRQLRQLALDEWRQREPKAAAAREGNRRFGKAVPPLAGVIAVFAVVAGRVPWLGGLAGVLAATALACALGLLSLAPELRAILRTASRVRASRSFARRDDEEAVIACALALAWREALPPVLGLLQR